MATLISKATGNFTDITATWRSSIAGFDSLTNAVAITVTTAWQYSANVTPGIVTVDSILLQVASISASPTGTMTVTLRNTSLNSDVVSVICNVSDLNSNGNGWYQFEFASQTLLNATTYAVGVSTSSSAQVNLFGTGSSNWNTAVRSTTDGTVGSGSRLFCLGKITGAGATTSFTLTMDQNSTTAIGSMDVGCYCTVSHSTSANTELRNGNASILNIWGGGTYNIGTSGTPVPSGTTALLTIGSTVAVASGVICNSGFTFNAYGATVGTVQTLLTSDAASAQAVLNVGADTNWAANDLITVAGTKTNTRTVENMTISSIASLAVTCTANLTNAHNGTNSGGFDTRAEVGHFTRNVKIQATSTASAAAIYVFVQGSSGAFTANYAEFVNLGSATGNKRGLDFSGVTGGTHSITYCAFRDSGNITVGSIMIRLTQAGGTLTFSNNNLRNMAIATGILISVAHSISPTADSNWLFNNPTNGHTGLSMISPGAAQAWTNLHTASFSPHVTVTNFSAVPIDLSHWVGHEGATSGLIVNASSTNGAPAIPLLTANPITLWGHASAISTAGPAFGNWKLTNPQLFGNASDITFNTNANIDNALLVSPNIDPGPNRTANGGPATNTSSSIQLGSCAVNLRVVGGSMGASNTPTAANILNNGVQSGVLALQFQNCNVVDGAAGAIASQSNFTENSFVSFQNKGASGTNITYYRSGSVSRDTAHVDTGFTSCTALTPTFAGNSITNGLTLKQRWYFPVTNATGRTVTVRMKKDGSYNGANPQLTLNFLGSAITGPTAQAITTSYADYTIVAAGGSITEDGVIEVLLECDGSAGNIYVQTCRAS